MVYIYTEIRTGFHQNPLPSGKVLTSKASFADFLMMLKAPLISALIILPEDVFEQSSFDTSSGIFIMLTNLLVIQETTF